MKPGGGTTSIGLAEIATAAVLVDLVLHQIRDATAGGRADQQFTRLGTPTISSTVGGRAARELDAQDGLGAA
jgi:hypothetical protein